MEENNELKEFKFEPLNEYGSCTDGPSIEVHERYVGQFMGNVILHMIFNDRLVTGKVSFMTDLDRGIRYERIDFIQEGVDYTFRATELIW